MFRVVSIYQHMEDIPSKEGSIIVGKVLELDEVICDEKSQGTTL